MLNIFSLSLLIKISSSPSLRLFFSLFLLLLLLLNFFCLIERVFDESFDFYCFADHDDIWQKEKLVESIESKNQNTENNEDKPLQKKKVKKQKKKSKKVLQPFDLLEPPSHLLDSYYDLDLSEEFLSQVLKYVDDLCNFINNGDSNLERTMEINQNISTAVGFYR